jgi:hypothetical protein
METLLLTGYIMFSIFLNILSLFISAFYKKKFNQPAPRFGFLAAIILAVIFIFLLYVPFKNGLLLQIISAIALFGSGSASIYSILYLFFTMRRVRK